MRRIKAACCSSPTTQRNQHGEYTAEERALYVAAVSGDADRVAAILQMPGVRPTQFRHPRVRSESADSIGALAADLVRVWRRLGLLPMMSRGRRGTVALCGCSELTRPKQRQ